MTNSETKYLHCGTCTHEFEVEYSDGVPVFVDGMEPVETDTMGDIVFDVSHTDRLGNDCDNRFITVSYGSNN